jgi:hypothetical protein
MKEIYQHVSSNLGLPVIISEIRDDA